MYISCCLHESKQTWVLAKVYCQFEANFRTLMIEETLSAAKFRFEAKIQRKSALCSNEMSLKRPRTFDRIFARTFDERSLEQITKFAVFRLHYFCTILYPINIIKGKTESNILHVCITKWLHDMTHVIWDKSAILHLLKSTNYMYIACFRLVIEKFTCTDLWHVKKWIAYMYTRTVTALE